MVAHGHQGSDDSKMLAPTLWRTCRALANRRRLEMLRYFMTRKEEACVSDVAAALGTPLPVTSQYLRALNSRGLIAAKRTGRHVLYHVQEDPTIPASRAILRALRCALTEKSDSVEAVFRHSTAFTHPRRIAILRAVAGGISRVSDIRAKAASSQRATLRHIRKLVRRGYLAEYGGGYRVARPESAFAQRLMGIVLADI